MYYSANIMKVIKSRGMRWAGHAAGKREKRNIYKVLVSKIKKKRQFKETASYQEENKYANANNNNKT
jgi:hypothetical protein